MNQREFAAQPEPKEYAIPAQWDEVLARYAFLGPSIHLDWVREHTTALGARRVLLEHQYIDADYRNEYANFYVRTFRWLPDRCERLHFWTEDGRYVGYCSIRPIPGAPLGRTMLLPASGLQVACLTEAAAHPYGQDLAVEAWPFVSQDRRYGRCAHAVIWMISHFHWLHNGGRRWFMSDLVEGAAAHEYERLSPSAGLTEEQIGATFRHVGLSALRYAPSDPTLRDLLVTSYMNSRMPLALGVGHDHLTALIGCYRDAAGVLQGITSDDERAPYCGQRDDGNDDDWTALWVPLPGRIYLCAEDAMPLAESFFASLARDAGLNDSAAAVVRDVVARDTRVRVYVEDIRRYKRRLRTDRGNLLPRDIVAGHLVTSSSRWVWVGELQDVMRAEAGEPCVLAEIAMDATSSFESPHMLFANHPGVALRWNADGDRPQIADYPEYGIVEYPTGTALGI